MKKLILVGILLLCYSLQSKAQYNFIKSTVNAELGDQLRVYPTSDKGWIVFTKDSLKLSKFNGCGQNEWSKKYTIPNSVINLSDFIQSSNGDYLLLTRMPFASVAVSLITRIDPQGIVLWSKSYQDSNYFHFPYTLSEDQQGNIYLFANVEHLINNNSYNLITKADVNGNIIWSKFYDQGGIWGGAITTTDNGLLFRTGPHYIKIDSAGAVQWQSLINGIGYNYYAPLEVSDGYLITGSVNSNPNFAFAKIDKSGNLFWNYRKTFNLPGNVPVFCKRNNGNFIGTFFKGATPNSPTNIIEFDKDANIINQTSIGVTSGILAGKTICYTIDNYPLLTGIVGNEIFTAKLDMNFKSYCDAPIPAITIVNEAISQSFVNTNVINYPFAVVNIPFVVDTFSVVTNTICYAPKYLNLGNDTTYCDATSIILQNQNTDIFENYLWSTGETTATISVNKTGKYWLHATYNCGENTVDDTIEITIVTGMINELGPDLFICKDSIVTLNASVCTGCIYNWSNGSTLSKIEINKAGTYWLTINHGNGCITTDTVNIFNGKCDCNVYLPNAFTPDNDGINDVFKPVYDCDFNSYDLKIFNRWGALIFETTSALEFWDGTFNSSKVQEGIYLYTLSYQPNLNGKNHDFITKTGTVAAIY